MPETLARQSDGGELTPEAHEQALERESGLHLKLERAPGLADGLRRALGGKRTLRHAVLEKLVEPVGVDDGSRRSRGRDDEVPVPAGEDFERIEDFFALGAA